MGRYDKIKVYHNGSWKTPTVCKVYYNSAWRDLGSYDSFNTNSLYTRYNNAWHRITLNRRDTVRITDQWAQGTFSLKPKAGFCYCPKSTSAGSYDWYFRATILKTEDVDQNVFFCGQGSPSSPGANYVQVKWLANGKIRFATKWEGNNSATTYTFSPVVLKNQSVYLNIYANKGTNRVYISFNGQTDNSGSSISGHTWMNNQASNTVGDTYMQFRSTLSAAGVDGGKNTYSRSFDASTATVANDDHSLINHQETTVTDTEYI